MQISLLCTNKKHPIIPYLMSWKVGVEQDGHKVAICSTKSHLGNGDILFLISCSEKIGAVEFNKYRHVLVLHASDLPIGRGWSPHIWEILRGGTELTLSLIEAVGDIDTGDIWKKINIQIRKDMLWNEINHALFTAELELMAWAINNHETVQTTVQDLNVVPTYWPKRTTQDSCVDIYKSLSEQFDLLRICDPIRYPAYFEMHGRKYKLKLEPYDEQK